MADWQVTVGALTMGEGTPYAVDPAGIAGLLGTAPVRTNDVPRGHADGDVAGVDTQESRLLVWTVTLLGDDTADCLALADDLRAAFEPTTGDVTMTVELPGATYTLTGRPRGCEIDMTGLLAGVASALCRFRALDPAVAVS